MSGKIDFVCSFQEYLVLVFFRFADPDVGTTEFSFS